MNFHRAHLSNSAGSIVKELTSILSMKAIADNKLAKLCITKEKLVPHKEVT